MLAVLQPDPGRPTSLTRKLNKGPYCRLDAEQKDGSPQACAVEYSGDVRGDLARNAQVLFLDFDQDAQNRTVTPELYQPFCIRRSIPRQKQCRHDCRTISGRCRADLLLGRNDKDLTRPPHLLVAVDFRGDGADP
jgi:hypothetical protein